ncbi:MAG: 3-methyl-2-oxobutanoate dehydrogenase subunit VorB [Candidatus Omnitrophica bacterium]|nr:3-methyl-2-oxobutanoate dehydrogenase subunit VorB [Candidatus Omnitrophota bacterium]
MTGNEAIAEGAIQAGCGFYAGYPITPQNELIAYMAAHLADSGGVFIQAESELAAINMVFGASACGVRAMTSSSSPGISLKQEGISYIAGAQLPAVIVNVMRGGPGLGNIWPSQADYFQATRGGGHGDYRSIVLAPSTVQECYECMPLAFSLADQYRMPAIILSDGMLGQMMEPVLMRSHKPLAISHKPKWALGNSKGRSPNVAKSFYLREGDLEKVNLLLQKKYKTIEAKEQRYQGQYLDDAKVVLVAYGTMARIIKSITHKLRGQGKKVGLLRPITLWPFPVQAFERLALGKMAKKFLVVEMSAGQMLEDVKLVINGRSAVGFLGRLGGGMPSEEEIIKNITSLL